MPRATPIHFARPGSRGRSQPEVEGAAPPAPRKPLHDCCGRPTRDRTSRRRARTGSPRAPLPPRRGGTSNRRHPKWRGPRFHSVAGCGARSSRDRAPGSARARAGTATLPVAVSTLSSFEPSQRETLVESNGPLGVLWVGIALGAFYIALIWLNTLLGFFLTPLFVIPQTWLMDAIARRKARRNEVRTERDASRV